MFLLLSVPYILFPADEGHPYLTEPDELCFKFLGTFLTSIKDIGLG